MWNYCGRFGWCGRTPVSSLLRTRALRADVIAAIRGARAFSYFTRPFSQRALEEMLHLATECPAWDEGIEMLSGTDSWIRLSVRCDIGKKKFVKARVAQNDLKKRR
jgi:hypothetical protein